jgi:RNA-directed DNA polymerase
MELSMEKTKITSTKEGIDFLGYRVVQDQAVHTGHWVGKFFIPKNKLNDLRHKIKVTVRETPTGKSLTTVIDKLNPILLGWRNYYRYAAKAYRDFSHLDYWIGARVGRWLKKKHRNASWQELRRRYLLNVRGQRRRWAEGPKRLRLLCEGGTMRYPHRSIEKPNGWNADMRYWQDKNLQDFWEAFNRLRFD